MCNFTVCWMLNREDVTELVRFSTAFEVTVHLWETKLRNTTRVHFADKPGKQIQNCSRSYVAAETGVCRNICRSQQRLGVSNPFRMLNDDASVAVDNVLCSSRICIATVTEVPPVGCICRRSSFLFNQTHQVHCQSIWDNAYVWGTVLKTHFLKWKWNMQTTVRHSDNELSLAWTSTKPDEKKVVS